MSWTSSATGRISTQDLDHHLAVSRYGNFELTAAIRPSMDLQIIPRQGYRVTEYRDRESGAHIPMLAAAVSREKLFSVFLCLLDALGDVVDVVLESHHHCRDTPGAARDYLREFIDLPVLKSYCHDFEDVLLDDGCFGIAVVDPSVPCEIQFDDHKAIIVYARDLKPFVRILEEQGIARDNSLRLLSEGEHLHSTSAALADRVESMRITLCAE